MTGPAWLSGMLGSQAGTSSEGRIRAPERRVTT